MKVKAQPRKSSLKQGVLLGVQASIMASGLLWVVIILDGLLFWETKISSILEGSGVIVILTLATIFVSLIPGSIGGALNSYILSRLAFKNKLTTATSIGSGFLIGFVAGFITVVTVEIISADGVYHITDAVPFALLNACVAAPVGAWHGWRVGKWLMKNE